MSIPIRKTVFPHLGLGDAFVINGMIRHFAKEGQPVEVFTKEPHIRAVRRMYSDLRDVRAWWLLEDNEFFQRWQQHSPGAVCLGIFSNAAFDFSKWDQEFYRQAGVPFEKKWSEFSLPKDILGEVPACSGAAILHENPGRGVGINHSRIANRNVIPVSRRPSIWDWMPEIRAAEAFEVVDSSILNLVDLMWSRGWLPNAKRFVFHRYAKNTAPPVLRAPWTVLT